MAVIYSVGSVTVLKKTDSFNGKYISYYRNCADTNDDLKLRQKG